MKRMLITPIVLFLSLTLLLGIIYPLLLWGIGNIFFRDQANGSLVLKGKEIIGSRLIAQSFTESEYFHPRPSTVDYNASASGGSNYGPSNFTLVNTIRHRIERLKNQNPAPIPIDMVMSSASGLDPDISLASALWQVPRVARARGIDEQTLVDIISRHAQRPLFGFIGEARINVLLLNIYLDNNVKE